MVIVVSTVSIAVLGARRVRRREDDNGAVQALAAAGHGADRAAAGVYYVHWQKLSMTDNE